jgi:hypothetical protein
MTSTITRWAPLHTHFRKGIDGERRKIINREAVVHQLVNRSATADLRATKMLFDMIKNVDPVPRHRRRRSAAACTPAPKTRSITLGTKVEVARGPAGRQRRFGSRVVRRDR